MVHSMWANNQSVATQLEAVQTLMQRSVQVKNQAVATKINDYITAGGKMLRPALMIYFSKLRKQVDSTQILHAAAATELFHIATLLHDDVIDGAHQRRGLEAFQVSTSNRVAIYAGDYLITLSALLFNHANYDIVVLSEHARSVHQVLAGELFQYENLHRVDMTMRDYLKQVKGKTAKLFALSAFLGRFESVVNNFPQAKQAYLVGEEFGIAFQIIDDLLDYVIDTSATGKPRMQDVKNGIYTAPLLFALQVDRERVEALLQAGDDWTVMREEKLYQTIEELGGFLRTQQLAKQFHLKAIRRLQRMAGPQQVKQEIMMMFESVLRRNF